MSNQGRVILLVCFLITLFLAVLSFLFCNELEHPNLQNSARPCSTVASVKAPVSSVASVEKAIIPTASNDNLDYTSQGLLLIIHKWSLLP